MFQALQVVSLEIEHKEKSKLHRLKEINLAAANNQIHSKIYKSTQAQFLAEVLYKTVREEEANSALFDYIVASMAFLNEEEESNIGNFHLVFLIGLSRFLGFFPSNNYSPTQPNFNMMSGEFVSSLMYQNGFDGRQGELFSALLDSNLSNMSMVKMSGENRRLLLNGLLHFYQIHLPEMGDIQSLEVLEELFS
jgi:DNA repair protein RecO (recombination protein O)